MNSDYNKERAHNLKEELLYVIDEKNQQSDLTEKGRTLISPSDPDGFVIPDLATLYVEIDRKKDLSDDDKRRERENAERDFQVRSERIHTISQLLKAYGLYEKDKQYVVQGGKVMIVDENTGRLMPGRRWSNGLHQAVEAKENVQIEKETKTYATITIQNYFRMYDKLSGMTGTALTEAGEFSEIYKLEVTSIPTNVGVQRADYDDEVYRTSGERDQAVIDLIADCRKRGQPVLVGTVTIDKSEALSAQLTKLKVPHQVLNARFHAEEAGIIAEAGVNHNGDVDLARQLIDVAVQAGADAVKFQTFKAERLVSSTAPKAEYQLVGSLL